MEHSDSNSSSSDASSASSTSTQWPSQSSNCSTSNTEEQTLHYQEILNRALDDAVDHDVDATAELADVDPVKEAVHKAAELLYSAEVLLLVTGAGFSADSGLATYIDVADINAYRERGWRYRDLCRPFILHGGMEEVEHGRDEQSNSNDNSDGDADHEVVASHAFLHDLENDEMRHPQYFYGFWGQCINDYRKIRPHEGYDIIARWGRDKNSSISDRENQSIPETSRVAQRIRNMTCKLEGESLATSSSNTKEPYYVSPTERAGAFFFFTSNVDAHSYDVFHSHEIRECHGNTEVWQCRHFGCGTNADWDDDSSLEDAIREDGVERTNRWERRLWRLPLDHVFEVDSNTMSAPPTKSAQREQNNDEQPLNSSSIGNLPKKRKSNADLSEEKESAEEVLDYLQNQFATVDGIDSVTTPAHIGDVHGKPRLSHLKSMTHPTSSNEPNHYLPISPTDNWPRCPRCHDLARPAVLMFDDLDWVYNSEQEKRWQRWYRAVLKLCKSRASGDNDSHDSEFSSLNESDVSNSGWEDVSEGESECKAVSNEPKLAPPEQDMPPDLSSTLPQQSLKVLILEIGCGYNVPTCRMISETLVKHLTDRGGDATLVRVNPTHPEVDDDEIEDRFIGIEEKGLHVLKDIDALYQQLIQRAAMQTIDKTKTNASTIFDSN